MFFRYCLIVLVLMTGSACELKIKESEPDQGIRVAGSGTRCLGQFSQKLRDFHAGRLSERQVTDLYDCMIRAGTLFRDYVRGKDSNQYTPIELQKFLENYFLAHGEKMPDSLRDQIMILKTSLFGGIPQYLKRDEINLSIEFLKQMKRSALLIRPYMPLAASDIMKLSEKQFVKTLSAIKASLEILAKSLESTVGNYRMTDFEKLLKSLESFLEKDGEGQGPRLLQEHLKIFQTLKALLISPPQEVIMAEDWPKLLRMGGQWWSVYLQFKYFLHQDWKIHQGKGQKVIAEIMNNIRDLLIAGIEQQEDLPAWIDPVVTMNLSTEDHDRENFLKKLETERATQGTTQAIPFDYFDDFFLSLEERKYLPERLTAEILSQTLRPFVRNFTGGREHTVQGRSAPGITREWVMRIWRSYTEWNERQKSLNLAFSGRENESDLKSDKILQTLKKINPADGQYWNSLIAATVNWYDVSGSRLQFTGQATVDHLNYNSVTQSHWMRQIIRTMMEGYSRRVERLSHPMRGTQVELHHFYMETRRLGEVMGWVDPLNSRAAASRFREANLFTQVANGDDFIDEFEGVQLLQLLISGARLSTEISNLLDKECPRAAELDRLYKPQFEFKCSQAVIFKNFDQIFNRMPGLVEYYRFAQKSGDAVKSSFEDVMILSSRTALSHPDYLDSSDRDVLAQILHYIESAFFRYDLDKNGIIRTEEASLMFPVFKKILTDLAEPSGLTEEGEIRDLLYYLLDNGEKPSSWGWNWGSFDIYSNRRKVLSIMATFGNPK